MALEGFFSAVEPVTARPATVSRGTPLDAQREADRRRIIQDEMNNATDPETKAGLARELGRLPGQSAANDAGPLSGALRALGEETPGAPVVAPVAAPVQPTHTRMVPARKPETLSDLINPPKPTYLNAQQMRMMPRYTDPASIPAFNARDFPEQVGGGVTDMTGSPALGAAAKAVTAMAPFNPASVVKRVIPMGVRAVESLAPRALGGSVGAAGVAPAELVRATAASASPELQGAVEAALKKGPVNHETLVRHVEADSLPVPVRLSEGQATQDVELLSREQNNRGKYAELSKFFNQQNKDLVENTNLIREQAAPDVYTTTQPAHGETIIDAYKSKDAVLNKDISAKYQALRDANGGDFPLDVKTFANSADAALHKELLYDHVPPAIRSTIERMKDGGSMTFENFESLRTRLAAIQRSNVDGNVKAAAGTIRDALEQLPMPAGTEHLKPLADQARAAAKARFDLIGSDSAYKSVVNGKAVADNFVAKNIVGAPLKSVQTLMANIADDPAAQQTVRAGVIDLLKNRAGLIDNTGNFSQAGYNRALEQIRPKLDALFDPATKQHLEALGNVSRYTQAQPRGSFVNNSNTLVGAMGEMAKAGVKGAAEGAANVAAGGVPVGTWFRKASQIVAERKAVVKSLKPGSGLGK